LQAYKAMLDKPAAQPRVVLACHLDMIQLNLDRACYARLLKLSDSLVEQEFKPSAVQQEAALLEKKTIM
jgi:hypothetical protein